MQIHSLIHVLSSETLIDVYKVVLLYVTLDGQNGMEKSILGLFDDLCYYDKDHVPPPPPKKKKL